MTPKLTKILLLALFVAATGVIYYNFYRPAETGATTPSGNVVEINVRTLENQWTFEPNQVQVQPGDKVILRIFNEDFYDHGFAIEAFGVNSRLSAKQETKIEFIASGAGSFSFSCSILCGEGHYGMQGVFIVGD